MFGPNVTLPDATKISPTEEGELPLPSEFSTAAKKGTVLPQLKSTSLISVGPLCDDKKLVVFDEKRVRAFQHTHPIEEFLQKHKILLQGQRNTFDGCWDVTLPVINSVVKQPPLTGFAYSTQSTSKIQPSPRNFKQPIAHAIQQFTKTLPSDDTVSTWTRQDKNATTYL